jgi:hypothetical protein
MLPFLKEKKIANVIIANRKPNGDIEPESEKDDSMDHNSALKSAASDLMSAMERKDVMGVLSALNSFFEIRETMPHEEAEYEESEMME